MFKLIIIAAIILIVGANSSSCQRFSISTLWLRNIDFTLIVIVIIAAIEHLPFANNYSQRWFWHAGGGLALPNDVRRNRLSIIVAGVICLRTLFK